MNEAAFIERHADMRRASADRFEEDQITGADIFELDFPTDLILVANLARQCGPMPSEDVLNEAAAVEAGGIHSAIPVRHAKVFKRGPHDIRQRFQRQGWLGRFRRRWRGHLDPLSRRLSASGRQSGARKWTRNTAPRCTSGGDNRQDDQERSCHHDCHIGVTP